jgi:hypothetical protein
MMEEINPKYDVRLNRVVNGTLSYDIFRSEICHMYHFDGDSVFISKVMKTNLVMILWNKREYAKALYVLALIDYISWKNDVPLFDGYAHIRKCKLENILYPSEVILMDKIEHTHKNRDIAVATCKQDECGVFFFRHNIIERSIEDVI